MLKSLKLLLIGWGILITHQAQAALGGLEKTRENIGFNDDGLWVLIPRILNWIFSFLGVFFLLMMILGGISWMINSRSGKEKEISKAKNLLTSAVVGLIIISLAYAVTAFLGDTFGPK